MCRFPKFDKDKSVLLITICFLLMGPLSACAGVKNKSAEEFKGKIAREYKNSKEWWPSDPKPPAGAPNVIIFLLDDVGFAQVGSFGGLIATPNIDRLAKNGLRFNNFHTTALCSPSRASLMAGRKTPSLLPCCSLTWA